MEKTYVFNSDGGANGLMASIPLLQQRGIDPACMMGMMNNRNGGFGVNSVGDLIGLIIAAGIFGGGNGNGLFGGNNNNNAEREMILQAINRNGSDIATLASSFNCSTGQLNAAINGLANLIAQMQGQIGLSSQQIINAFQSGNSAVISQMCNCCCELKQLISESNFLTERGFCNTNQILTKGFSDLGYAFRDQTCDLKQTANANTAAIIAKLDAIEDSRKDRELAEKDRVIATLTARSERQAELQPIYSALQEIQCNQPPVKKISCPETYVPINRSINENYGLMPYCGFGGFGNFSGWNNCGNGSLWG